MLELAGKDSKLHERTRLYLDIVVSGLPFLPHPPIFHPQAALNKSLRHFHVAVLDVVDVVVSKLKRFNRDDADDVEAMIKRGLVDHKRLVERFNSAVDKFSMGSRADDIPRYIKTLHRVERDLLRVPESNIELPAWMQ